MDTQLSLAMVGMYLLLGVITGSFSATLGLGGGIILVPALTLLAAFPQKDAQGISLAVMIPMCVMALIRYHINPEVKIDWQVVVIVGIAMVIGANLGASLMAMLSARTLEMIFALLMFLMGVRLLWQAFHPEAGM